MINLSIFDKSGKVVIVDDLNEIRYEGYDGIESIKDFDLFQKEDHITYTFLGKNRTVNITGVDIKYVVFDKA